MNPVLYSLLGIQALLGAFDNLWHHEWQARLPQRPSARKELALHAAREALYGLLFGVVAWLQCRGLWAAVLASLLAAEMIITLADFLEEDRTRKLPPFERLLHTVLTALYGAFLAVMAPVLLHWLTLPTALVLEYRGPASIVFSAFSLGVFAWSLRNLLALRATRNTPHPAVRQGPPEHEAQTVLVTGGTGFVGSALVNELLGEGWRVILLSRDLLQARATWGNAVTVTDRLDSIAAETRIDAVVHLAGARVLGMPWTAARRRTLLDSRVHITRALVALMNRLQTRPRVFVAASALGFYGVPQGGEPGGKHHETPCDETAPPVAGQFASGLCSTVEQEAMQAEALGVRVVRMRFAVVLGRDDGAFPMQALAARFGLATVLGTGQQPMPWVHLADATALVRFAIATPGVTGPVNAVAPQSCTQAEFSRQLAATFGRRVFWRVPAWPLRRAGGEMMSLLLDGRAAVPAVALREGYRFQYPSLSRACADLAAPRAGT
jgi:uncharacterized protein